MMNNVERGLASADQAAALQEWAQGSKALLLKMLIRAMYDMTMYLDSNDKELREIGEDAREWLFGDKRGRFSLSQVASTLGLSKELIRYRTRLMTKDDVRKVEYLVRGGS